MNKGRGFVFRSIAVTLWVVTASCSSAFAEFDLQITIPNPGSFTAQELEILNQAIDRVQRFWEWAITDYQPGISIPSVPVTVIAVTSGLASAEHPAWTSQGGFRLTTQGIVNVNVDQIENFANWQGDEPNGLNFIDELLAHEVGHVLGIGTHWTANNVYITDTYQYTGTFALAAYLNEFDSTATFVPVESAGAPGTPNAHWDQLMRSAGEAGDPSNPWVLDPRVGVTDQYGRDRSLELMTGAIDPDWREPFVSRLTVESMRDLGYTVAAFEDFNGDESIDGLDLAVWNANLGQTGLQIDSVAFGDADRDRDVDDDDYLLWRAAAVPASTLVGDYDGDTIVTSADFDYWKSSFGSMTELTADGNANGEVDAADYVLWRNTFGQTGSILAADGNLSHEIDDPDFSLWSAHFGETNAPGFGATTLAASATDVSEPATLALLMFAALGWFLRRQVV